ncbi:uncharacterized protein LOC127788052 [Diospyros lotus]|uniref:uncharacterized protein LOC127788052 n=1 Tax=Diospyros lotus TaxID=55363 RepID=UPI002256F292|nr:uncharacterized protein LOC127788052 [Diospyros lotus]
MGSLELQSVSSKRGRKDAKPVAPQSLSEAVVSKIREGPDQQSQRIQSMSFAHICRVPEDLRKLKETAYTPRLVSIGPLHRKDEHLENSPTEDIKTSYATLLIYRATKSQSEEEAMEILNEYKEEIWKSVDEAKTHYAEEAALALNQEMLLVDACFILELLYRHDEKNEPSNSLNNSPRVGGCFCCNKNRTRMHQGQQRCFNCFNKIFGSGRLAYRTVQRDLLLLENQIPFFVIKKLFELTEEKTRARQARQDVFLINCVLSFFSDLLVTLPEANGDDNSTPEIYHILHLLHMHYRPANLPKAESCYQFIQSASDLECAGVKFKSSNAKTQSQSHNAKSPFQVKFDAPSGLKRWWFSRASFEIPTLHIDDSTELFLRNLMAFEQCCPSVPSYITSYAFIMDRLINTSKDVDVLQKAGIICNYLGSHKDASDLFNKLCSEIELGDFHFAKACRDAAEYSSRRWPQAVASLRRNNFNTPWAYLGFGVAFILFLSALTGFIRNVLIICFR